LKANSFESKLIWKQIKLKSNSFETFGKKANKKYKLIWKQTHLEANLIVMVHFVPIMAGKSGFAFIVHLEKNQIYFKKYKLIWKIVINIVFKTLVF
jgi:hypothetical protein